MNKYKEIKISRRYLLAVDVHVFSVCPTLSQSCPVLAVLVEVLTKVTNFTSDGTVGKHPGGVTTALRPRGPCSAISSGK